MIYTKDGVPLNEHLATVALVRGVKRPPLYFPFEVDVHGVRLFHTMRDKLGDLIRIYHGVHLHRGVYTGARLRRLRAERGVGRPA